MVKTGSKQKSRIKELHLAILEHKIAADEFRTAMLKADLGYMVDRMLDTDLPLTPDMKVAGYRFIAACYRLKHLS